MSTKIRESIKKRSNLTDFRLGKSAKMNWVKEGTFIYNIFDGHIVAND